MTVESPGDADAKMDMGAVWGALKRRGLRIIFVTLVLLAGTYALLTFVPKMYESTASILVESRDNSFTRAANDTASSTGPNADSTISSQIELVKSRDTLLTVVHSLHLTDDEEFNGTSKSPLSFLTRLFKKPTTATVEDIVIANLQDRLTVIRERDSALISVIVRTTRPQLSADLANAIAKADVARRADLSLSDTADASQWLQQQIVQMQKRVADAEGKVANFKVDNDLYSGTNNSTLLEQQMSDISNQITAAQARKNTAQSRSTLIRGLLAAGQPIDGVEDVRNSVTIQQLMTQKAQLTSQRAQLLATLLPNHPSVQAVVAQIVATDRQIQIEGRRVADALDAEVKIEGTLQTSLELNLATIKDKAGDATKQGVTLDQLDREAKADRDLLEGYMSRYRDAASRTDANAALPDVRVVTQAAPELTPVSPKTTLILSAVGFVSLAVQIAVLVFGELLSGRALVEGGRWVEAEPTDMEEVSAPEPVRVPVPAPLKAERDIPVAAPTVEEAEVAPSMIPAVETPSGAAGRPASSGLRSWFSKRAKAVGTSLTAFEPPIIEKQPATSAMATDAFPSPDIQQPSLSHEIATETIGVLPVEAASFAVSSDAADAERLNNLSADLILGRVRVVMIAALDTQRESEALADRLIADVLHRGLSVVRVDAGSGRPSTEPGITDLSAERAGFGDVVQKTGDESLAEVPWGHLTTIDRRSTRPITLIEALSDIYEVVIVLTGRIGMASSLPMFAGIQCRLVLVAAQQPDEVTEASARADAAALGYDVVETIVTSPRQAAVA
jgi:succinoglycan biosynthesis transport protein ExoP